jgi:hypothetical protein
VAGAEHLTPEIDDPLYHVGERVLGDEPRRGLDESLDSVPGGFEGHRAGI